MLNIIKYGIGKKHIVPEYIGYCSYTRAAAKEGIDRVLEKFKGTYKEDLELQVQYYQRNYSWKTPIQEWKNFFNYVRQQKNS